MDITVSRGGTAIRLTEERWFHVTEEHSEMAGYYFDILETIRDPEAIYQGRSGELLAVKEVEPGKYLVAVYKEASAQDGFVITAFLTRGIGRIERRTRQWPR